MRTKRGAANQIAVFSHVKLTCGTCSLRDMTHNCMLRAELSLRFVCAMAAMRSRLDVYRVCDDPTTTKSRKMPFSGSLVERFNCLVQRTQHETVTYNE